VEGTPLNISAAESLPREALLELPVDLLCPCARGGSINAGNAARITARYVCAGANNPLTPDAEQMLWARGVIVPPDFISNAGGVLGGTLEYAGVSPARAGRLIAGAIEPAVRRLLEDAAAAAAMPRAVAEPKALARHARVREAAERPSLRGHVMQIGLDWYRRGWLPAALVGAIAPAYVGRRLHA
jgi:glutamate dehydrogenase/leucine dehydrogenase